MKTSQWIVVLLAFCVLPLAYPISASAEKLSLEEINQRMGELTDAINENRNDKALVRRYKRELKKLIRAGKRAIKTAKSDRTMEMIKKSSRGELVLDMEARHVRKAWGNPSEVKRANYGGGIEETWYYWKNQYGHRDLWVVWFRNDRVTDFKKTTRKAPPTKNPYR